MPIATYNEFLAEIGRLRAAGRAADALALAESQGGALEGHVAYVHLWRMTLACALGQSQRAIGAFAEAIAGGCRYPEATIRDWPGIEQLRGVVEFDALARTAATRYEFESRASRPRMLVEHPVRPPPDAGWPLLVVLHGNNSSERETLPQWTAATDRDFIVAAPGSAEISLTPGRYLWNDGARSRRNVVAQVDALARDQQIDRSNLVIGGFSIGALRALELAYSGEVPSRGVIVVAPWLQPEPFAKLAALRPIPTYVIVGEDDRLCLDAARALQVHVAAAHVPIVLQVIPGVGHAYPRDMQARLKEALDLIFAPATRAGYGR